MTGHWIKSQAVAGFSLFLHLSSIIIYITYFHKASGASKKPYEDMENLYNC